VRFKEREVARVVRAAHLAGKGAVDRIEVDPATGKIAVILAKPGKDATDKNEWDESDDGKASTEVR
jgi:hypothetical protein